MEKLYTDENFEHLEEVYQGDAELMMLDVMLHEMFAQSSDI